MMVQLTDISQGVSLDGKGTQVNRLHFRTDTGRLFSIKVAHESLEELLREVFGEVEESKVAEVVEEEDLSEPEEDVLAATNFGGEEDTGEEATSEEREYRRNGPVSEEEVPSL